MLTTEKLEWRSNSLESYPKRGTDYQDAILMDTFKIHGNEKKIPAEVWEIIMSDLALCDLFSLMLVSQKLRLLSANYFNNRCFNATFFKNKKSSSVREKLMFILLTRLYNSTNPKANQLANLIRDKIEHNRQYFNIKKYILGNIKIKTMVRLIDNDPVKFATVVDFAISNLYDKNIHMYLFCHCHIDDLLLPSQSAQNLISSAQTYMKIDDKDYTNYL